MICLIGESGSGKSTIEKILCQSYGWKKVVSYTTRPMRNSEQYGVDYNFINDEQFEQMENEGLFAETTIFRDWHYGSTIQDLKDKDVLVIEPIGLRKLLERKEELNLNITTIYINVSERERMIRMLKRGDDVDEVMRRIHNDRLTFADVDKLADVTLFNERLNSVDLIVDEILRINQMNS